MSYMTYNETIGQNAKYQMCKTFGTISTKIIFFQIHE